MLNSIPCSMMSRTEEIQSQETNTFFDGQGFRLNNTTCTCEADNI